MSQHSIVFEQLVTQVKELMAQHSVPGVALGLRFGGETFTAGLGVTSITNPLEVNADTFFQIGSISKTYTALAIAMLVEQGKLALKDPVIKYLPELKLSDAAVRESVTVEQLLTHTAGWDGDIFTDTGWGDDALAKYVQLLADAPQVVPNGGYMSYNNAGFSLAGRLIEVVTGEVYENAIQKMIFEPLGLTQSLFFAHDVMLERFAAGHVITPDEQTIVARPWQLPRGAHAAGGIVCTVQDMLRYGQFMVDGGRTADGTALLTPEGYASLTQPREYANYTMGHVALSWFTFETKVGKLITHGGGTNGQISELVVIPEAGLIFAMVTNSDRGTLVNAEAMKSVLKALVDVEMPELTAKEAAGVDLSKYAMRFTRPAMDFEVRLNEAGELKGQLIARYALGEEPPQFPEVTLGYVDEHVLVVTDTRLKGTELTLIPDENGRISHARLGGRLHIRAD